MLLALWLRPAWHAAGYVGGVVAYLVAQIAFALAPSAVAAGAALLLTGLSGAVFATLQATIVYLAAPTEMRSRILGVLSVCVGTGPVGFLWLGWFAERIGADWATAITGCWACWRWLCRVRCGVRSDCTNTIYRVVVQFHDAGHDATARHGGKNGSTEQQ